MVKKIFSVPGRMWRRKIRLRKLKKEWLSDELLSNEFKLAELKLAMPFLEHLNKKTIRGYKIDVIKAKHEAKIGIILRKGRRGFAIDRLNIVDNLGKRLVSVEELQGTLYESKYDCRDREKLRKLQKGFNEKAGIPWAQFLLQISLDAAWKAGYDGIRVIRAEKHPLFRKYRADLFRGLYDWNANKVGIRKKEGNYWVLYFP